MIISLGGWQSTAICLAREINALPRDQFYFLGSSDFKDGHPILDELTGGTSGLVAPWLDLKAEDMLRAEGRWNGRGRSLLVRDAYPGSPRDDSVFMQLRVLTDALHELAHIWERYDNPLLPLPTAETDSAVRQFLAEAKPDVHRSIMLMTHSVEWIRFMIHLHHRTSLVGMGFSLHDLLAYSHMGWPEEKDFQDCLKGELDQIDVHFDVLRHTPVPYQLHGLYMEWAKQEESKSVSLEQTSELKEAS